MKQVTKGFTAPYHSPLEILIFDSKNYVRILIVTVK